ncbi:hypothetical protein OHA40_08440 [Nocardia sp. NBC_00508]|uniref:hypothetical protein n=1 Tax=Nocardia sp. NBC_00508 TaxID=2975992 RepID=UPI002E817088|nr:hypothetical protein [Nocardia sp. NBC_00508]WUD68131.1 hypothetical protein OHA40_08440 [Nocardia sp. NBC_00508]
MRITGDVLESCGVVETIRIIVIEVRERTDQQRPFSDGLFLASTVAILDSRSSSAPRRCVCAFGAVAPRGGVLSNSRIRIRGIQREGAPGTGEQPADILLRRQRIESNRQHDISLYSDTFYYSTKATLIALTRAPSRMSSLE